MKPHQEGGYLLIDHRASPGLPNAAARLERTGIDTREGRMFEASTLTCAHCRVVVIKNPERTRERECCQKCGGAYICDVCKAAMREPGYVHMSFQQLIDDVKGGKVAIVGGTPSHLILQPLKQGA